MSSSDYSDGPRLTECPDGLVVPQEVSVKEVEIFHAEKYDPDAREETVESWSSNLSSGNDYTEPGETGRSSTTEETKFRELTPPNSIRLEYETENWILTGNSPRFECEARNNCTPDVSSLLEKETKDDGSPNSAQSENGARETVTSPVISAQENRESWTSPISQETDRWKDSQASLTGSEVSVQREEKWSDTLTSPPGLADDTLTSDTVPPCEQNSEMYYTASSEVSLLSDTEIPEKAREDVDKDESKECVIAGHVAAMRERFESMTRANTPCPELLRSSSPSLDIFRNITPSPDRLG